MFKIKALVFVSLLWLLLSVIRDCYCHKKVHPSVSCGPEDYMIREAQLQSVTFKQRDARVVWHPRDCCHATFNTDVRPGRV